MKSDNITKINQKFDEIKKDAKKRPRPLSSSPETTNESQASLKRPRKPNSKYTSISFENLGFLKLPKEDKVSKRKVKDDNIKRSDKMRQLLLEKEISESKTVKSKSKKISPTKDELKKRLAELEKKMKNPTGM
ncbi:hypothetical protein PV328_012055, partial [Microctonus aethiopoides]